MKLTDLQLTQEEKDLSETMHHGNRNIVLALQELLDARRLLRIDQALKSTALFAEKVKAHLAKWDGGEK